MLEMQFGVPQEPALGPTLFLTYVTESFKINSAGKVLGFADATNKCSDKDQASVKKDYNNVYKKSRKGTSLSVAQYVYKKMEVVKTSVVPN